MTKTEVSFNTPIDFTGIFTFYDYTHSDIGGWYKCQNCAKPAKT